MPVLENSRTRQPGQYETSIVAAPARGQGEATMFHAVLNLDPADLLNPNLHIGLWLMGSVDNVTWTVFGASPDWVGGRVGRDGTITPPGVSWAASQNGAVGRVFMRWTQDLPARVGASLDFERVVLQGMQVA